jgi:hypothetical protein
LSWSRHGKALLGHTLPDQNLQPLPAGVIVSYHVMMLEPVIDFELVAV